jgi:hypothetical protein
MTMLVNKSIKKKSIIRKVPTLTSNAIYMVLNTIFSVEFDIAPPVSFKWPTLDKSREESLEL